MFLTLARNSQTFLKYISKKLKNLSDNVLIFLNRSV